MISWPVILLLLQDVVHFHIDGQIRVHICFISCKDIPKTTPNVFNELLGVIPQFRSRICQILELIRTCAADSYTPINHLTLSELYHLQL